MKKRIHINQHVIRANKKNSEANPPITVKTSKSNHYTYAAEIDGLSRVVYSPDKPLLVVPKFGNKLTRQYGIKQAR